MNRRPLLRVMAVSTGLLLAFTARPASAGPEYEAAYVGGQTVTINAIEVHQNAQGVLAHAAADFYQVVYPPNWEALGLAPPQCNPCDHDGGGIDLFDFHDHTLDSMPSSPGHGEFNPLWHVFLVVPAISDLTGGDPANDPAIEAAYAGQLPATSEDAVDTLLASTLADGTPIAIEIDTQFYFLCSVVDAHAAG